jgi:hypothetical protein
MKLKDKLNRAIKKSNWKLIEWNGGFIRTVSIEICVTEKGKDLPIRFSFKQEGYNGKIYQQEEFTLYESKAFMTGTKYKLDQLKEVIGVDPSELDFSIPREMVKFTLSEEELRNKELELIAQFNKEMFG